MGCKKTDAYGCVIQDDAAPILNRMPECDAVVLATPVYWFGPTAQLKALTDRMFSLVKFTDSGYTTPFTKTRFALVATGGGGLDDGLIQVEQIWKTSAGAVGLPFEALLVPNAPSDPAAIENDADLKSRAAALGRKLAGA
jgi:multimeric flavodoxin WrbA